MSHLFSSRLARQHLGLRHLGSPGCSLHMSHLEDNTLPLPRGPATACPRSRVHGAFYSLPQLLKGWRGAAGRKCSDAECVAVDTSLFAGLAWGLSARALSSAILVGLVPAQGRVPTEAAPHPAATEGCRGAVPRDCGDSFLKKPLRNTCTVSPGPLSLCYMSPSFPFLLIKQTVSQFSWAHAWAEV